MLLDCLAFIFDDLETRTCTTNIYNSRINNNKVESVHKHYSKYKLAIAILYKKSKNFS